MPLEAIQAQAGLRSVESTRIFLHLANVWLAGETRRYRGDRRASDAGRDARTAVAGRGRRIARQGLCRACSVIMLAITSAGTLGWPQPVGNRSANISSGNNSRRSAAKNQKRCPPSEDARHRLRIQQFPLTIRSILHLKIIPNNTDQQTERHANYSGVTLGRLYPKHHE